MKTFFTLALAGAASATLMTENDFEFMKYITEFNKSYATVEEFNFRKEQFLATHEAIKEFAAETSVHGHNKFSDWTRAEYSSMMGIKDAPMRNSTSEVFKAETPSNTGVNWVTAGKVTPVKDQGQCGSCWAFSATGSMESSHMIAGYSEVLLSEQQLVDCARSVFTNHGCNGGWYYYAWDYAIQNALETESDYPYVAVTGTCTYNASLGVVNTKSTDYTDVNADSSSIKSALAIKPNSVAIEADTYYFQSYKTGILTNATKCGTNIDHAVLAVGWGVENGTEYYLVKNSWGTSWGENGYVKIGISEGAGTCGINQNVAYVYTAN